MSFLRRLFTKKVEEDYETVLSNLADDIQKRQLQLSEIRLRERRSTLLATLYTLAAWVAYFVIWYLNALPGFRNTDHNPTIERVVKGTPILVGPVVVLFIRRIVQIWYMRKGDGEEKALRDLMKRRREKVEEIKKKTNYYSTRDLLQKYDESSGSPLPLRHRVPSSQPVPATPQRPVQQQQVNKGLPLQSSPNANPQAHNSPVTPSHSVAPSRKQWYDRLADAILGDEDLVSASPSSRYALICEKCFAHNGLVKEGIWEDAQYLCPKCGHFNQSARSKRQSLLSSPGSANASPAPPNVTLPRQSPERQQPLMSSPSPKPPTSDLPTVDSDESMSMVVDADRSNSFKTS